MLTPAVAHRVGWFYASGNTPATSLTRSVPHGEDAALLSLGCGDLRNILYTAYVEKGLPPRKLDITCCDIDEKIIGRNILLLTLIIDNDADDETLWNIYYHLYLDAPTAAIVEKQAEKLLGLLKSSKDWNNSQYGKTLKFCDADTLHDVRGVCQRLKAAAADSVQARREALAKNLKRTADVKKETFGSPGTVMTGMRSAAPLSLQSRMELPMAYEQYWKDGTVTPKNSNVNVPNPMFAGLISYSEVLHYGTDPVLGYHLATGYAPLIDSSPLKPNIQEDSEHKAADAAKKQFSEWVSALRERLHKSTFIIRFVVSDAFAFCHSLQHAATAEGESAGWFRRQFDWRPLKLDSEVYGKGKPGATKFDLIDTSNLADHFGPLNILVSTSPLLRDQPWATVYTEILIKQQESQKKAFDILLCGHAPTLGLLLGVAPVQYWTNAKVESHVDEIYLQLMSQKSSAPETQLRSRIPWKRDDHFSGNQNGRGRLHIDPKALSRVLFDVYVQMFRPEHLDELFASMNTRLSAYNPYHRGSFAVFLSMVKNRVRTDWNQVCRDLLDKIAYDKLLGLSSNHMPELSAQLYMLGVAPFEMLLSTPPPQTLKGILGSWDSIPPVVAITLEVPHAAFARLFTEVEKSEVASPTLMASIRSGPGASSRWHNMYSSIHIAFGKVKSGANGSKEVAVERDESGWEGTAPVVVSFYAPASALQLEPVKSQVGLYVMPTGQSTAVFGPVLGPEMSIFETHIGDKTKVFASTHIPGQTAFTSAGSGVESFNEILEGGNNGSTSTKITADVPASESQLSTLTGHLDILSEKGKKLLKDKVIIELRQASPHTIDVVFGEDELSYSVPFPVPVTKEGIRSRVARTSGYIEIIAPFAEPASSECLADFIYPSCLSESKLPASFNMPNINLDRMPAFDLEKKKEMKWLTTLTSFIFSTREKRLRDVRDTDTGISDDPRVNFKESLFTMFMISSGLQGGQTGLFSVGNPDKGGIHMLFMVSAIRLDGDAASVVLDAAVIPFTEHIITSKRMEEFLLMLRSLECGSITVNDAELELWKKMLPAAAERCRTWSHGPKCEYKKKGATIPLNLGFGEQVLCSCGSGKFPDGYTGLPQWEQAAPDAVRVALSPTYPVPFVEEVVDASQFGQTEPTARCQRCGKISGADGGPLKRCTRCQEARYCSVDCQRKDWKTHRMECEE